MEVLVEGLTVGDQYNLPQQSPSTVGYRRGCFYLKLERYVKELLTLPSCLSSCAATYLHQVHDR